MLFEMSQLILHHLLKFLSFNYQSRLRLIIVGIGLVFSTDFHSQTRLNDFVNPMIGTGGHGHTFPGAVWPFGMVQLSPDTRVDGSWDGCSGYHYSDKMIYGFSHTHLSGTGCSDWGDVLLMPLTGTVSMNNKDYASTFSHNNEKASAGYYKLRLDKHNIDVELTVSPRVGIHHYTFPKAQEMKVLLDLLHRDKTLDCNFTIKDSVTITGFRISEAWAKKQMLYFAIKFSKPIQSVQVAQAGKLVDETSKLRKEGAVFSFGKSTENGLMVKVSISQVSESGALNNLEVEAPHWNFETYRSKASDAWENQLQKIKIEEEDKNKKTVFYSALYHCFIHPSLSMDVDGRYRGRDFQVHKAEGFVNYSVFSLWDTYRALHPLFTLLEPERTSDFIQSFLNQYQQSGRLPMWELSANETDCMIGFHSVSVIADSYLKGIRNFDVNLAYEAMKAASNYTGYGIPIFNQQGYLQIEDENESVSKSLEYAYDNWCISQMAVKMGKTEEAKVFFKRSQAYKNLFDSASGHLRPRKNGSWLSPFYPEEINNHFTEGNSWQYSFYVPHDVEGLMELHGGKEQFENKLDSLFQTSTKTRGREQADVTGLIGQYAHGNEPSHHMAFLYNYTGEPKKTIYYTRKICNEFYKNSPDGLIGNEDCGQMSAWYVFAAMGFYPVCPGSNAYALSTPLFKTIDLSVPENRRLKIQSDNNSMSVPEVVLLNGKPSFSSFIQHDELIRAGRIEFKAHKAGESLNYGKELPIITNPLLKSNQYIPAPIIETPKRVFQEKSTVSMHCINSVQKNIYYTFGKEEITRNSSPFRGPLEIDSTCTIRAKVIAEDGLESGEAVCRLNKIKYPYEISTAAKVNSQYAADGLKSLFDGIRGDWNWRKGDWLGYQAQDVVLEVDMLKEIAVGRIALNCLQDRGAWIFFPKQVSVYVSVDNKNFDLLDTIVCDSGLVNREIQNFTYTCVLKQKANCRFLRIELKYPGKLPDWHPGAGGESFIFMDELEIE
jgi:predicted alpha-1,2-mannosidase